MIAQFRRPRLHTPISKGARITYTQSQDNSQLRTLPILGRITSGQTCTHSNPLTRSTAAKLMHTQANSCKPMQTVCISLSQSHGNPGFAKPGLKYQNPHPITTPMPVPTWWGGVDAGIFQKLALRNLGFGRSDSGRGPWVSYATYTR